MALMFALVLVAAVVMGVILYLATIYNGLIRVKNDVDRAWGNVDVLLKQRHDEIPKLIASVEAYMKYEKGILQQVLDARQKWQVNGTVAEKVQAAGVLDGALRNLFAIAENYPDLKANTNFVQFQQRVSGLETNLSDRREYYNAAVTAYNTRIEQIPDVLIASSLGFSAKPLYPIGSEERIDPVVQFKAA